MGLSLKTGYCSMVWVGEGTEREYKTVSSTSTLQVQACDVHNVTCLEIVLVELVLDGQTATRLSSSFSVRVFLFLNVCEGSFEWYILQILIEKFLSE